MEEIDKEDNCVLTDSELDVAAGGYDRGPNGGYIKNIICMGRCKQCRQPFEIKIKINTWMVAYTCTRCGVTENYDRIHDLQKKELN